MPYLFPPQLIQVFPDVVFLFIGKLEEIIRMVFFVLLPELIIFFAVIVREFPDVPFFLFTGFPEHESETDAHYGTGKVGLP